MLLCPEFSSTARTRDLTVLISTPHRSTCSARLMSGTRETALSTDSTPDTGERVGDTNPPNKDAHTAATASRTLILTMATITMALVIRRYITGDGSEPKYGNHGPARPPMQDELKQIP